MPRFNYSVHMITYESAGYDTTDPAQFEKIASKLREMGYSGVEPLTIPARLQEMRKLREICASYQIVVPMMAGAWGRYGKVVGATPQKDPTSVDQKRREDAVDYIRASAEMAAMFGAPYVQVALGSLEEQDLTELGKKKAFNNLVDVLRLGAREAKGRGVEIVFEPQCRYEGYYGVNTTVGLSIKLIKEVREENLSLMFDTFHANIEEVSLLSAIQEGAGYFRHVHVADNNRLPPGSASIDFKAIQRQLAFENYKGYLGIECMPIGPDVDSLLQKSLNYLRSIE